MFCAGPTGSRLCSCIVPLPDPGARGAPTQGACAAHPSAAAAASTGSTVPPRLHTCLPSQLCTPLPAPRPSPVQVLLNKVALSSFEFRSPNALLFYQCALCVLLVHACRLAGLVKVEPFNWQIIKVGGWVVGWGWGAAPCCPGVRHTRSKLPFGLQPCLQRGARRAPGPPAGHPNFGLCRCSVLP